MPRINNFGKEGGVFHTEIEEKSTNQNRPLIITNNFEQEVKTASNNFQQTTIRNERSESKNKN